MKYRNGWSQMNFTPFRGRAIRNDTKAVAAAASEPSSLTSINALCVAASNLRPRASLKPEKSASIESNMSVNPILTKVCKERNV